MTHAIGTPKTLAEAISNGKAEALYSASPEREVIEKHIKDFIRQKFSPAFLQHEECAPLLRDLLAQIEGAA